MYNGISNPLFYQLPIAADALLFACLAISFLVHYGCIAIQHFSPKVPMLRSIATATTVTMVTSGIFLGILYGIKAMDATRLPPKLSRDAGDRDHLYEAAVKTSACWLEVPAKKYRPM